MSVIDVTIVKSRGTDYPNSSRLAGVNTFPTPHPVHQFYNCGCTPERYNLISWQRHKMMCDT